MIEELTRWADDGGPCLLNDHDEPARSIADEIVDGLRRYADDLRAEKLARLQSDISVPEWDGDYEDA